MENYKFTPECIKRERNIANILSRLISGPAINEIREISEDQIRKSIENYHFTAGHSSAANMKFHTQKRYKGQNMFRNIGAHLAKWQICLKSEDSC